MKGMVAYDSVNGNTRQVAEAIAEVLKDGGLDVEIFSVKDRAPAEVTGDVLFIGSPTRGGKMTKPTKVFVEGLNAEVWRGKEVIAFDTLGPLSKDAERRRKQLESIDVGKNAATTIRNAGEERGINFHPQLLHFAVVGMWGPLADDALDKAREVAREIMVGLRKP
ncbi:MAG: hypothetical protein GXX95_06605 [Methanomassiliicoccus sp.]|nr:hypothetical protein [Methanomassiliicoccus sp.]